MTELQQALCALCLLLLVMGIVALNDEVLKNNREGFISARNDNSPLQRLNRAIASAQPKENFKNLSDEKKLRDKITKQIDERNPASFGRQPSAVDETIYKTFASDYAIVREKVGSENKVVELRFEENLESPTKPMTISNVTEFLEKYRSVWAISFVKPVPQTRQEDQSLSLASYTYQLKDEKNKVVGTAEITVKAGGLTHLQFRREASIQD